MIVRRRFWLTSRRARIEGESELPVRSVSERHVDDDGAVLVDGVAERRLDCVG